jgi:transmembrane sensor
VALIAVLVIQPWRDIDTYDTGIGEQRLVVLQDGTRMSLNTSTRVQVELSQAQRRVSVEGGEALFEVAKDTSRPFVVQAAGIDVTATGTAFAVRLTPSGEGARDALDVTLVEGQVVVRGASGKAASSIAQPIVLAAGERIRFQGDQSRKGAQETEDTTAPQRDRPRMDQVLAWKRGEAVFDNALLPEALAEVNRYSAMPITADASLAQLRISGQYKTGDNPGFARAVAALHGLSVREHAGRLELVPR